MNGFVVTKDASKHEFANECVLIGIFPTMDEAEEFVKKQPKTYKVNSKESIEEAVEEMKSEGMSIENIKKEVQELLNEEIEIYYNINEFNDGEEVYLCGYSE